MKKKIKSRQHLSADKLIKKLRSYFLTIKDHRKNTPKIKLADALMSGFALFSLKYASLMAFDERKNIDRNLKTVYLIGRAPSDTHMRELLDEVDPEDIYPAFKKIFAELQRGNDLKKFLFLGEYYLASGDGTGYFSSETIHCDNCLEKRNKKTGEIICYHHQFYGLCIVHPDMKEVIPLAPEPIMKQDGDNKNDCERNASKRCLERFRRNHPHLKTIIIEDALASNAPHIRTLQDLDLRFILGAKQGDHKVMFEYVDKAEVAGKVTKHEFTDKDGTLHKFRFINKVPLNNSNKHLPVNFVEYWEIKKNGKKLHFSWVTDFEVTKENVFEIMRGGRARWKIENETFNTLKNQGYNFEHNFGHGYKNLSTNFALLMMLAFLVDQAEQIACPLFKLALAQKKSKKSFWEELRTLFFSYDVNSMADLLSAVAYGFERPPIQIHFPP